jgi:hypothetical protein
MKQSGEAIVSFALEHHSRIQSTAYAAQVKSQHPQVNLQQSETTVTLNVNTTQYSAVWDTGAPYTVIVPKVVRDAGLTPNGFRDSAGIDGEKLRRRSCCVLGVVILTAGGLSCHICNATVLERDDQLRGIDILIGMDVMSQGTTIINRESRRRLRFIFVPAQDEAVHIALPENIRRNLT